MDVDTSQNFITSLATFLQNLCSGYVPYEECVLVTGQLYLTIDAEDSIEYVVNEKVCKKDDNNVDFVSNSFYAQSLEQIHTVNTTEKEFTATALAPLEQMYTGNSEKEFSAAANEQHSVDSNEDGLYASLDGLTRVVGEMEYDIGYANDSKDDQDSLLIDEIDNDNDDDDGNTDYDAVQQPTSDEDFQFGNDEFQFETLNLHHVTIWRNNNRLKMMKRSQKSDSPKKRIQRKRKKLNHPNKGNVKTESPRIILSAAESKLLRCGICDKPFKSAYTLKRHKKTHFNGDDQMHACHICGKKFVEKRNLATHIKLHSKEKSFQCPVCFKCFARKADVTSHSRIHTGEKPYKCTICKAAFYKNSNLSRHMKTCNERKVCLKTEESKVDAASKYKQADTSAVETGKSSSTLPRTSTGNLITGQELQESQHDDADTDDLKPGRFKKHRCDVCGKDYAQLCDLITHKRVHTGERPFVCELCGKGFTQKCNLVHHRRIHTGERPHSCSVCGKSFAKANALKEHSRVHSGEKPYQCEICGADFKVSSHLQRHKRTIHSDAATKTKKEAREGVVASVAAKTTKTKKESRGGSSAANTHKSTKREIRDESIPPLPPSLNLSSTSFNHTLSSQQDVKYFYTTQAIPPSPHMDIKPVI